MSDQSDQALSDMLLTPCAVQDGSIQPVLITKQRDITFYTFTLSAEDYMELGRVERFGESENGVNRQLKERRAFAIAESMIKPDTVFAENPVGSLEGDWQISDGALHYKAGAYISLDDGQHRRAALEILNAEERARWEFTVTATRDVPYAVRLKLFMQQTLGQTVDARLMLAMRGELGEWASETEARAYNLCKELATDPRSPLKGLIILGETDRRPYEGKHRPAGINVKGLHLTFTSLMSKGSPLSKLSPEKQLEVIKNLIRAASHTWKHAWMSDKHILTTARGINAVCQLVVSGNSFRMAVGNDFTYENLLDVLGYASRFDWGVKKAKGESVANIRTRLDNSIGNAMARQIANSADTVQV